MTATKITAAKLKKAAGRNPLLQHIAGWVIARSSDYGGDLRGPLKDLFYGGCESGMVGHLIYYKDTVPFAKKYHRFILEMAIDTAESMGDASVFTHLAACGEAKTVGSVDQLWNFLAWYGFEEGARKLADAVGYEG